MLSAEAKDRILNELKFISVSGNLRPTEETSPQFAEVLDFAAATKEKKCKTGTPCGKSCISASKTCKTKPAPDVKEKITAVKEKLKKEKKAKTTTAKATIAKATITTPTSKTSIVTGDDYEVANSPSSGRFVSAKASATVSYGEESHKIESTVKHAPNLITDTNGVKNSYSYEFRIDGDTLSGKVQNDAMKLTIGKTLNKQFKQVLADIPEGAIVMNAPEVDDGKGASRARAYEKHGFSKAYTFEVSGHDAKPVQYAIKQEGKLVPWKPSKMPKQVKKFKEAVF